MPKRTNEFQQLVYLIQRQLEGTGKVTESKLLTDSVTQKPVEVDIVVETTVNGVPLTVGLECNAEKRKASIEWVREMLGKHNTLPITTTVLVSKRGFSKDAIALATRMGLVPLTLSEATDQNWREYVESLSQLKMAAFEFTPVGGTRLTLRGRDISQPTQFSVESRVRVPKTRFEGSLRQLVLGALESPRALQTFMRGWLSKAPAERMLRGRVSSTMTANDATEIQLDSGEWWPVLKIEVELQFNVVETKLSLAAAGFGNQQIAYGRVDNIFSSENRTTKYVLLNMIGEKGIPSKASLLFPAEAGHEAKIYNLNLTAKEELPD